MPTPALPLRDVEVLVVDCQATAASPRGHLLEIGWMRTGPRAAPARARLITPPDGARIPPAVVRITGISDRMVQHGVAAPVAWHELRDEAGTLAQQPAPTVIHFARFEQPFLRCFADDGLRLDIVCTHEIASRLLPDLPRRSLRALAGYFGHGVGVLRRSADHVGATAFVWRELVRLLEAEGVMTWSALQSWLANPVASPKARRRAWPMAREVRLALPHAPGVYRLLRTTGDVLYVGKAASLHDRVNSYFRHRHGVPERMLELLSQARAISYEVTPTALEAALLEPDEIKRLRPPYNVALTADDRQVWFTRADLGDRRPRASARHCVGPFPSAEMLDQFAALAQANRSALMTGRWGPDETTFAGGYARFCAAHRELHAVDVRAHRRLLRVGTRLWREGRRDREAETDDLDWRTLWTPESVQIALERLALRAALARRRARWFTRLVDAAVIWREPGSAAARLLLIEAGEIAWCGEVESQTTPPIPPGHRRPRVARQQALTLPRFDRLRVLTTELKRLAAENALVAVRLGPAPALSGARVAAALSWV